MDCKHILEELNLYIDGDLEKEFCRILEAHLEGCDRCRIVLDTTRRTIQLYRDQTPLELPKDVRKRLHAALRARRKGIERIRNFISPRPREGERGQR